MHLIQLAFPSKTANVACENFQRFNTDRPTRGRHTQKPPRSEWLSNRHPPPPFSSFCPKFAAQKKMLRIVCRRPCNFPPCSGRPLAAVYADTKQLLEAIQRMMAPEEALFFKAVWKAVYINPAVRISGFGFLLVLLLGGPSMSSQCRFSSFLLFMLAAGHRQT